MKTLITAAKETTTADAMGLSNPLTSRVEVIYYCSLHRAQIITAGQRTMSGQDDPTLQVKIFVQWPFGDQFFGFSR